MADRDGTVPTVLFEWHQRAKQGETWDSTRYVDVEKQGFPTLPAALEAAENYYRRAVEARSGRERGLSLKAMAQTLYVRRRAGLPASTEELLLLTAESEALLDPEADAGIIAELAAYGAGTEGTKVPFPVPDQMLTGAIDDLVARLGQEATVAGVLNAAQVLMEKQPERVLERLQEMNGLFTDRRVWDRRAVYWDFSLQAFIRAHAVPVPDVTRETPLQAVVDETLLRAERDRWSTTRLAAVLLQLARRSMALDNENGGLHLLKAARETAPVALEPLQQALDHFEATLLSNEGANLVRREKWDHAAKYYVKALLTYANLDEGASTANIARRLFDVVVRGGVPATVALGKGLESTLEMVETVGGQATTEWLQQALRAAVRNVAREGKYPSWLWSLARLTKGRRFATMLAARVATHVTNWDGGAALLEKIVALQKRTRHELPECAVDALFRDTLLLTPYSRGQISLNGSHSQERLENLEHYFDIGLQDSLLCARSEAAVTHIATEDVALALPARTVVLDYLLAEVRGSESLLMISVMTCESAIVIPVGLGQWKPVELVVEGKALVITDFQGHLASVRASFQPGSSGRGGPGSAADPLRHLTDLLMPQPLVDKLARLRAAGKDHLCIVPHGGMHYAPLHLLGTRGGKPSRSPQR